MFSIKSVLISATFLITNNLKCQYSSQKEQNNEIKTMPLCRQHELDVLVTVSAVSKGRSISKDILSEVPFIGELYYFNLFLISISVKNWQITVAGISRDHNDD